MLGSRTSANTSVSRAGRPVRTPSFALVAPLLSLLTTTLASREAQARSPLGVEIGADVAYGTSPGGAAVNPLGIGFGGRAGITLSGLYVGADAVYYLGSGDGNGGEYRALQLGGELGYGIKVGNVTIRPRIGAGDLYLFGSLAGLTSPALPTANCLYAEGGASLLVSTGVVFLGVEANALILPSEPAWNAYVLTSSPAAAFTGGGEIGLRF
jgi:hypothetical protein